MFLPMHTPFICKFLVSHQFSDVNLKKSNIYSSYADVPILDSFVLENILLQMVYQWSPQRGSRCRSEFGHTRQYLMISNMYAENSLLLLWLYPSFIIIHYCAMRGIASPEVWKITHSVHSVDAFEKEECPYIAWRSTFFNRIPFMMDAVDHKCSHSGKGNTNWPLSEAQSVFRVNPNFLPTCLARDFHGNVRSGFSFCGPQLSWKT